MKTFKETSTTLIFIVFALSFLFATAILVDYGCSHNNRQAIRTLENQIHASDDIPQQLQKLSAMNPDQVAQLEQKIQLQFNLLRWTRWQVQKVQNTLTDRMNILQGEMKQVKDHTR